MTIEYRGLTDEQQASLRYVERLCAQMANAVCHGRNDLIDDVVALQCVLALAAQGTPTQSAKTTKIGLVRRMVARWRSHAPKPYQEGASNG